MHEPERIPRRRGRVELDLQTVFVALLIGFGALVGVIIVWGLVTKTLSPAAALATGSALFSGVLAGLLAGPRGPKPPPPEEGAK